jgi:3',5'-cyclic AMP phosphodiesterase CpdA
MRETLQYRTNGNFKIVQLTDLHVGGGDEAKDKLTLALTKRVIELEEPDLVIYSGDMLYGSEVKEPLATLRTIAAIPEEMKVPFAIIFGNHDAESSASREELLQSLSDYSMLVSTAGPENIHGIGNDVLPILASVQEEAASLLYLFDSGAMASPEVGGYEWIHPDQIEWYRHQSAHYREKVGAMLPSLAFFHIPIPEYREAWERGEVTGTKHESVCCPELNSGLFTAIVECGDVIGTFAGHDHENDYVAAWYGIKLAYGRVSGYGGYGNLKRGARVIQLQEGNRAFKTWVRLADGSVVQDEP